MTNKYHQRFDRYIAIVLNGLPADVEEWVSCNVTLHEPPSENCVGFQFKQETMWHIIFPNALFNLPIKDRLFTMAHEIAHCYLGHEKKHSETKAMVDEQEKEADLLAMKWGF